MVHRPGLMAYAVVMTGHHDAKGVAYCWVLLHLALYFLLFFLRFFIFYLLFLYLFILPEKPSPLVFERRKMQRRGGNKALQSLKETSSFILIYASLRHDVPPLGKGSDWAARYRPHSHFLSPQCFFYFF